MRFDWQTLHDFKRILDLIDPRARRKALYLFALMGMQTTFELFFLLLLSLLPRALTAPESVNGLPVLRTVASLSPAFGDFAVDPRHLVMLIGICIVLVSAMKSLFNYLTARTTALLSENISIAIGHEIMFRYLYSPYAWHLSPEGGKAFQCMQWRRYVASSLMYQLSMASCLFTILVLFLCLLSTEIVLTTFVVGVTVLTGMGFYRSLRRHIDTSAMQAAQSERQENRAILCASQGIRDVIIYRQQDTFLHAVEDAARQGRPPRSFLAMAPTMPTWVLETMGFFVVILALAYIVFVEQAEIPRIAQVLGLLILTAWRVLPYANRIVGFQVSLRAERPKIEAVLNLLEELRRRAMVSLPEPDADFTLRERVTLRNISFRYPGMKQDSLADISLDLPIGKKIGIIGASGAGKSTLVAILSGLLHPTRGEILVDGRPLSPGRAAAYARRVGYVPQTLFLFEGTLAENIAFSQWGKAWDENRVREACRMAAIDFVDNHPQGLLRRIGANGDGLSGGQAQRVGIARALYASPDLLIFDESTSSLDQTNEKNIQKTIDDLSRHTTCILVAHRLTTVEHCDIVFWLDKGRLVMAGSAAAVLEGYRKHF